LEEVNLLGSYQALTIAVCFFCSFIKYEIIEIITLKDWLFLLFQEIFVHQIGAVRKTLCRGITWSLSNRIINPSLYT